MNPFALPGVEEEHSYPLCPEKWPEHDDLYVDVDNIGSSFQQFKDHFADPTIPMLEGRLVLTVGGRQCGKTSLVNRCAYWLTGHLGTKGITASLFDLRLSGTASQTVEVRMLAAAQQTVDKVRARKIVDASTLEALEKRLEQPDRIYSIYSLIGESMSRKLAVILLLPPATDAEDEVVQYARLTNSGLFFFIESPDEQIVDKQLARIREVTTNRPLTLRIGNLKDEDGKVFINKRLGKPESDKYAGMESLDIKRLMDDGMPIGALQEALFQVYQERARPNSNDSELDLVTYDDVTGAYFRLKMQGYGRSAN